MFIEIITTLQIKGTLNTPTFYDRYKTKPKLLGSRLKQGNRLQQEAIVPFQWKRQ